MNIFDLLGREVATIVDEVEEPGVKAASWESGAAASSGVYFLRMTASSLAGRMLFRATQKLMVLK